MKQGRFLFLIETIQTICTIIINYFPIKHYTIFSGIFEILYDNFARNEEIIKIYI